MRRKGWFSEIAVEAGATIYLCRSSNEWRPAVIIERGKVYAVRRRDAEYKEFDTIEQAHDWLGIHESPWVSDE